MADTPEWAREILEYVYSLDMPRPVPIDAWEFVRADLDTYDDEFAIEQTGGVIPVAVFRTADGGRLRLVAGSRYKVVGGEVVRTN